MSSLDFIIRKWEAEDIESLTQYANNKKIADGLRNAFPSPYTLDDAKRYIDSFTANNELKQCCRAIEVDKKAVGSVGIFIKDDVYCKSAEIGYWLAEPYWGKGIMTKAVYEMCNYGFKNYDIARIFAEPFATNLGSRRVLEKAGFTLEGILRKSVYKNGKIIDSCVYALVK